ncbi:hypothetical protein E4P82_18530 [Candidatus Competibacter phosphatis]|uniref:Uncharacterized protein n=1 Tax=Candidatus Competibacter phosphatis TaxID=221280 RepID=A0ABX1TNL0_9GAMM|nr:hypothetical protein [Candidatus Competibacter phosphatis]NMQ21010.1 hypothetical protein [Candidatus Competibacter phosphatis]
MKPWINEETIKTWTDAQKRLWESLCSAVPFQPPVGVEAWRETYLKNLTTWESAVRQTLEQEAAWVQQWVQRVAHEKGTPEMMASWVRQMEEVLQRWIQSQNQWWDEYFSVLRRGGLVTLDQAEIDAVVTPEPAPVAESAPTASEKPASAPPEAVASAQPEPMAEVTAEPPVVTPTAEPPTAANDEPPPTARIVETPAESPSDDLKLIGGIGPALEKKLNACGIFTYRQLAVLGDEDIERIEAAIKSFGRIRRDDWVGQAREQHLRKYQEAL